MPRLKNHLLSRTQEANENHRGQFSTQDHLNMRIVKSQLYQHTRFQVNYTTYDVRRERDVINLRTHTDIMLMADVACTDRDHEAAPSHLYQYARVLGIFHMYVQHRATTESSAWSDKERVDVLWVRWFQVDSERPMSWSNARMPSLHFVTDSGDLDTYGFVDPNSVIRGAHIIPTFASGDIGTDFLDDTGVGVDSSRCSLAHSHRENEDIGRTRMDYERYYVNM